MSEDLDEQQRRLWQDQFRSILGNDNAIEVSYGISYLMAQIAPLPQTRREHELQTIKINALALAIDDYIEAKLKRLLVEERIKESYGR